MYKEILRKPVGPGTKKSVKPDPIKTNKRDKKQKKKKKGSTKTFEDRTP